MINALCSGKKAAILHKSRGSKGVDTNPLTLALTFGAITFLLTVIWGGPLVEVLRRLKIGQQIRPDEASWQAGKKDTPTMGGILILVPVFLITLAINMVNLIHPKTPGSGLSILLPLFIL